MKVLRLSLSHDLRADIPEDERQYVIAQRVLEEATGADWETVVKAIWPTARLPELVDRWVSDERPDLVLVCLAGYWATFASVALRLERRVPVVGPPLAAAARRAAATRTAANSRYAEVARGIATRVVGVEYNFEPDELVVRFERVLHRLLRDERLAIAVRGPGPMPQRTTARIRRERERRYRIWQDGIQSVCERLHVTYLPFDPKLEDPALGIRLPGDPAHYTLEGTRIHGGLEGELMVRAWQAAHAPATG